MIRMFRYRKAFRTVYHRGMMIGKPLNGALSVPHHRRNARRKNKSGGVGRIRRGEIHLHDTFELAERHEHPHHRRRRISRREDAKNIRRTDYRQPDTDGRVFFRIRQRGAGHRIVRHLPYGFTPGRRAQRRILLIQGDTDHPRKMNRGAHRGNQRILRNRPSPRGFQHLSQRLPDQAGAASRARTQDSQLV